MADEAFPSSQDSHYEEHRILSEDQENIASSPPRPHSPRATRSSNLKPKALPTVTPKRFTKFFTPRASFSARGGRQSKAGRQLRDITKNGANRKSHALPVRDDLLAHVEGDALSARPLKRRKISLDIASSPPQSSPLKHVQTAEQIRVFEDIPASPSVSDDDALSDLIEQLHPFPQPIRRLRPAGPSHRILERSFGGYESLTRGRRGTDHCANWQSQTADFVTVPKDTHAFRGTALPFCTASCNTNSLIAIGDEEGSIRLIDSSVSSDFSKAHVNFRVHRNAVMDIAFSSNDFRLATASGDQTGRVVDMHTQQTLCILSNHTSSVKQVRFKPNDDNILTTSSRDGTVQIWDLRCSERGSMQSLRPGQRKGLDEDGLAEPSVRYAKDVIEVGPAHRSAKGAITRSPSIQNSEEAKVSITAIQHLPNGREHLLLTASELSASVKLWDLRNAGRRNAVPLSSTPLPEAHMKTRNFGISAMAVSGDGARLYTLCKDATVYAYATNHLILGSAPEMGSFSGRRRALKDSKTGLGPLYGFRHPSLRTGSFYLKASMRRARGDKSEMLAVGSTDGCAVLFPTDERHLLRRQPVSEDPEEEELPMLAPKLSQASTTKSSLPIYEQGTALVRGHNKEVTSLSWTHDGELVTVSDDFKARCWREDGDTSRYLRGCGEGGGLRWGHGWADVDASWDEDEV
ncbi:hypothetical protein LTR36_009923 [Oleoguttula mirabilis]|uniref:WD40 repeat-like protein n=1 Tax=Oleoguttula mirabilis TaxID=1507867 RepID=A0AAV9J4Q6_9PEZI|nr:hypothetical protein LTR36_009923 [Oleoguttula mirabilis]